MVNYCSISDTVPNRPSKTLLIFLEIMKERESLVKCAFISLHIPSVLQTIVFNICECCVCV